MTARSAYIRLLNHENAPKRMEAVETEIAKKAKVLAANKSEKVKK